MTSSISMVHLEPDRLGEGPQWNVREQRLYWVDAFAPAIRRLDPADGSVRSFQLADDIGSFVFCEDGSLIGGTRAGFQRIRLREDGGTDCTVIADPLARDRRLLLNDGKCDRRGRYWCASVHSDFIGRQAELFRLDPDLSVTRMDGDFVIGNGIAFSPDDSRMYLADSRDETVWVYDFDLDRGRIAGKRRFFSTAGIAGRVDGATCDTEGNYWCAPTMVTFGGPRLDQLYVTTARQLLPEDERAAWPQAGALLRIDGIGATGVAEPFFGAP